MINRITGIYRCVSKNIPIVQRQGNVFLNVKFLIVFEQFLQFLFQKLPHFLYYRPCNIFTEFTGGFVVELGVPMHANSTGILYAV